MNPRKIHSVNERICKVFFVILLCLFVSQNSFLFSQQKEFVVVIDAGHGGKDPGGIAYTYKEKEVALKVSLLLGKQLSKSDEIKVVYTRQKDRLVGLWKRGEIANKAKADLFVSIHCNTVDNSSPYGTETFVLGLHKNARNLEVAKKENAVILLEDDYKERYKDFDPNSPGSVIGLTLMQEENLDKSLQLATYIESNFKNNLKRKSRGVKQAGFVVLYQTYMPSVLIELGFLSNKNEGRFLNSNKGQQKMANQIAKAIKKYLNNIKLNTLDVNEDVVKVTNQTADKVTVDKESSDVLYKVQIASSKKKIQTKSYNFKGLKNVERVKVGKYYKYYYGNSSNYQSVKESLQTAKKKGYNSAFIAAFKNGEKISVTEARKSS